MTDARPLRDVFTDLVGAPGTTDDPAALLRDQGHPGLPDDLVAEAVVSYADTAPAEVAEHLAPYVTAHSAVGAEPGDESPAGWLDLLGSAPDVTGDEPADLDGLTSSAGEFDDPAGSDPDSALDFGTGAGPEPAIGTADGGGLDDEVSVEIPADNTDLNDSVDLDDTDPADFTPAESGTGLAAADLTAEASDDDDGEPGREPLG